MRLAAFANTRLVARPQERLDKRGPADADVDHLNSPSCLRYSLQRV